MAENKRVARSIKRRFRMDFWDLVDLVDDARKVVGQRQISIPRRLLDKWGFRESVSTIIERSNAECGDIDRCI